MSDKLWKQAERAIAKRLKGVRIPVDGKYRGHSPDVACDDLVVEVKERKCLPKWMLDALDQAKSAAIGSGLVPVVVMHPKGARHDDDVVLLRLEVFERLLAAWREHEALGFQE
jgi:hypothetical protein